MAKVLIQDSDADILAILSYILAEEGHDVIPVSSYNEAVLGVASYTPDVVILDFALHGEPCIQACKAIKSRFPEMPVIAVSCNKYLVENNAKGVFDTCIEKPFEIHEFNQVITNYSLATKSSG